MRFEGYVVEFQPKALTVHGEVLGAWGWRPGSP